MVQPTLLVLTLASVSLAPAQEFGPEEFYGTADRNRAATAFADVDGDGDLDIVTSSIRLGTGWIENVGGGAFGALHPIDARPQPFSVATGDLNGDGHVDVVASGNQLTGPSQFAVTVYLGLGSGRFAAPVDVDSGGRTLRTEVLDFDQDGDFDVLTGGIDEGFWWLENQAGSLSAGVRLDGLIGGLLRVVRDFDEDGWLDIAYEGPVGNTILLAAGIGPAQFATPVALPVATGIPTTLWSSDFDGDGDLDLILGTREEVRWLENDGAGTFSSAALLVTLPASTSALPLAVGDLDGDGLDDLVLEEASNQRAVWHRNLGGTAATAVPLYESIFLNDIQLADLDGDGDDDPVMIERGIAWIQNRGGGQFGFQVNATRVTGGSLVDFDGDGDLDVVGKNGLDIFAGGAGLFVSGNLGDGRFGRPLELVPGFDDVQDVVSLDVDGDSDLDLVVASFVGNALEVMVLERGDAGFEPPVLAYSQTGMSFVDLTVAHADADGIADVSIVHSESLSISRKTVLWLRSTANGPILAPSTETFSFPRGRFGDIDGDGDDDYIDVTVGGPPRVLLSYENLGDGSFATPVTVSSSNLGGLGPFALGDIDADGDLDVVFPQGFGPSLWWSENQGDGSFAVRTQIGPVSSGAADTVVADIDLDGDDDTVLFLFDGRVTWFETLGGGAFGPGRDIEGSVVGNGNLDIRITDLDADGDLDFFSAGRTGFNAAVVRRGRDRIGVGFCKAAATNSTGSAARAELSGDERVSENNLTLRATSLPPSSLGYFLVSDAAGGSAAPPGSQGTLCLTGAIGRIARQPSEIFQATATGAAQVPVDLTDLPTPTGSFAAMIGTTSYFQAWYRDANPQVTSNFTTGVYLRFR